MTLVFEESFFTGSSRLQWVSVTRSPSSSSHIACRLVNSLGTLFCFRLVRVLFLRSSGRLVVGPRTGSRIDIRPRDTRVHGRFDRRPGNLGSARSRVEVSK